MLDLEKLGTDYPPVTFLSRYAEQNLTWISTDTKERYNENCKNLKITDMIKQYDGKIIYQLNSDGFRCNELKEDPRCLVALGCSHTFGVGLPVEDTYCVRLAKMLDCDWYNLGVPAGSTDTAFRIASYWIPIIKPKYVVIVGPQPTRFEIRKSKNDEHVFVPGNTDDEPIAQEITKRFIVNDENIKFNRQKNLLAIENLTKRYGGSFYPHNLSHNTNTDWARDYLHYGPLWNQSVAEIIHKDIIQ